MLADAFSLRGSCDAETSFSVVKGEFSKNLIHIKLNKSMVLQQRMLWRK